MSETELEQSINKAKKDMYALQAFKKDMDLVFHDSEEKNKAVKDSLQLFISGVLGAVSALMLNFYFSHLGLWWFLVVTLIILVVFSFIFGYVINIDNYIPKKWGKKKGS